MLSSQWNALRPGCAVYVHDTVDPGLPLVHGEVEIVDIVAGTPDNVVVRADSGTQLVRPTRLAVHLDPLDATEACWRCRRIANGTPDVRDVAFGERTA